jgi:erythromycin esterase
VNAVTIGDKPSFLNVKAQTNILHQLGSAKVFEVGESTHGTKEFDQLKLEFLQLLVGQRQCWTLVLEVSWIQCALLNQSLQSTVSLDSVISTLGYMNLQTVEFRNLLQWIRTYNKQHPSDGIEVKGVDVQHHAGVEKWISHFISKENQGLAHQLLTCIDAINHAEILSVR